MSRAIRVVVLVVGLFLVLPAVAAAAADPPAVSIAGSGVTVHVSGIHNRHVTGSVVVANDNDTPATLTVQAVFNDGTPVPIPAGKPVGAHSASVIKLDFTIPTASDVGGQLAVTVSNGATAFTPLTVTRSPSPDEIWLVIGIALGLGFIAPLAGSTDDKQSFSAVLGTNAKWSFSGSWAQNVTSVTAILTTILSASGFLSSTLPGVDLADFIGLSLLSAGAVTIAPLIIVNKLTGMRFMLAAWVTSYAVFQSLATIWLMVQFSIGDGPQRTFVMKLVVLVALVLFAYIATTTRSTLAQRPKPSPGHHVRNAIGSQRDLFANAMFATSPTLDWPALDAVEETPVKLL